MNMNIKRKGKQNASGRTSKRAGGGIKRGKRQPWQSDRRGNFAGSTMVAPQWAELNLPSIQRQLSDHVITHMTSEESSAYMNKHNITSVGTNIPPPVTQFTHVTLPDVCHQIMARAGYKEPLPIQAVSWPIILDGRDMVGIAATGSGKTLAFVLPALLHIQKNSQNATTVLILAPTRELALQIQEVCAMFTSEMNIKDICIYGGASCNVQCEYLKETRHIVIATPGRLLQFLEEQVINLNRVSYLVLDEADRMLDMGFEPQIRRVLQQVRPDRHTVMWSATWPKRVVKMAEDYMKDYVHVTIGSLDLTANTNITQNVTVCTTQQKKEIFMQLIDRLVAENNKVLVFAGTKKNVRRLEMLLKHLGVYSIHGGKAQAARQEALGRFREDDKGILLATDVAGRGLDISGVDVVVNYDFPHHNTEDYIHRIGRTGRVHNKGIAYTLMTTEDSCQAKELIDILRAANQPVSQELQNLALNPVKRPNPKNRAQLKVAHCNIPVASSCSQSPAASMMSQYQSNQPTAILNLRPGSQAFLGALVPTETATSTNGSSAFLGALNATATDTWINGNGTIVSNHTAAGICPAGDGISGNPIGTLQEMCMQRKWPTPVYSLGTEEGPPHDRHFTINCTVGGHECNGAGKTKKVAKKHAAHTMLQKLKVAPLGAAAEGMET